MPPSQPDEAAQPAPAPDADPSTRAAELQDELERVRAQLTGSAVALSIDEGDPRESFMFGGVTVGRSPTPVPGHMVTPLLDAAADAGVSLTITEA